MSRTGWKRWIEEKKILENTAPQRSQRFSGQIHRSVRVLASPHGARARIDRARNQRRQSALAMMGRPGLRWHASRRPAA
jgi:hypothetical protein